jgi:peptidoglycan-associated lipoprotein
MESKMKNLNLFRVLVVSAALVIGVTACHHKPSSITPIPGSEGPIGPVPTSTGPGASGTVPGETAVSPVTETMTGIPENGNGKYDSVINGPHNEDREIFKNDTVYFDFDSATIKASEGSKLQDVATHFKSSTGDALQVEGNCDERGTEKYNLSLGDRRALAIREYLVNLQVDAQRIKTVTYGASKPVDPGHNEAAWSKNRRGDLVLLTPKK